VEGHGFRKLESRECINLPPVGCGQLGMSDLPEGFHEKQIALMTLFPPFFSRL
jgi:hypothetical protein